jgi:predicted nucleotidyltransferase
VFTTAERERVRELLLARAADDPDVAAAAITGSYAVGGGDEWSDIDLAFAIRGELAPALERWTRIVDEEFTTIHHWDLPLGRTVYRVFLLPEWLQLDLAVTPAESFGPRGPNWRTVFGDTLEPTPPPPPSPDEFIGFAWLCARHARVCIDRDLPWQCEWCISGVRDNVLALACLRLGYPTRFARAVDRLPQELTAPLEPTLVRSVERAELRRALAAASVAYADELERTDAALSTTLRPMLEELTRS